MQIDPREFLKNLYNAAVKRAQPSHTLGAFMPAQPTKMGARTVVVGAGKAGGAMAQAFEQLWLERYPNAPMSGMVVTRYGHTPPTPPELIDLQAIRNKASASGHSRNRGIRIVEAAHPVPDAAGLAAAEEILQSVQGLTADDLVVCLISGGGSS
jgi:glycerate 2-kinase